MTRSLLLLAGLGTVGLGYFVFQRSADLEAASIQPLAPCCEVLKDCEASADCTPTALSKAPAATVLELPCCAELGDVAAKPAAATGNLISFDLAEAVAPSVVADAPEEAVKDSVKEAAAKARDAAKDAADKAAQTAKDSVKDAAKVKKPALPKVVIDPKLGIVEGVIRLKGKPPKLDPAAATVPTNNQDYAKCKDHVKDERLLLGKKQELQNALAFIDDYKARGPTRPKPQKITVLNQGCTFVPHVVAMTVNSEVVIESADGFLHNTRGLLAAGALGNRAIPPGTPQKHSTVKAKKLRKPGMGIIKCDFHSWMTSWAHVFTHEMYQVTGADGAYRIVNIPPGKHKVVVWHEALEKKEIEIEVVAGKAVKLDIELEPYKD